MSVYIHNMEMPDKCGHCRFANAFDCTVTGSFISTHSIRQPDCPLVPVPEHGDLIDRVEFRREMDKNYPFDKFTQSKHGEADNAKRTIIQMLANAPTIIPADKEGEG